MPTANSSAETRSNAKSSEPSQIAKYRRDFFEKFPAYDTDWGCHINIDLPNEHDWDCVWDTNEPHECVYAEQGIEKEDCGLWQQKNTPLMHDPDDVWSWIQDRLIASQQADANKSGGALNLSEEFTDEYCDLLAKHASAMTTEDLHSKYEIAHELAHRDFVIKELLSRIHELMDNSSIDLISAKEIVQEAEE